jgi:hypothetical protein
VVAEVHDGMQNGAAVVSQQYPDPSTLEREYFHLHTVIENSDGKSLTIKAWSVTMVAPLASTGAFVEETRLLLFAAGASLMFWLVDTSWKTFQYANYSRISQIERFMRGRCSRIDNLRSRTSWKVSYESDRLKRFLKVMFWPHVVLPHGAMCALLTAVYFLPASRS